MFKKCENYATMQLSWIQVEDQYVYNSLFYEKVNYSNHNQAFHMITIVGGFLAVILPKLHGKSIGLDMTVPKATQ